MEPGMVLGHQGCDFRTEGTMRGTDTKGTGGKTGPDGTRLKTGQTGSV